MTPLNGEKTHPLTAASLDALRSIVIGPKPRQEFNAGVVNRLLRGDGNGTPFVTVVDGPSPYARNKGKPIEFLEATPEGVIAAVDGAQ